jgi:hypothetical protein
VKENVFNFPNATFKGSPNSLLNKKQGLPANYTFHSKGEMQLWQGKRLRTVIDQNNIGGRNIHIKHFD